MFAISPPSRLSCLTHSPSCPFQLERPGLFGHVLPAQVPEPVPTVQAFVLGQFAAAVAVRNGHYKEVMAVLRNHVLPAMGHKRLDRVTRQEVERWLNALREQYKPGTVIRYFAILKSVFNLAVREGLLGRSPCAGIEKPRGAKTRFSVLTQDESARLIEALKGANDIRATAILLIYLTNSRKMEILAAEWANVDWDRRILWVPHPKSREEARPIYLSREALAVLRALRELTGSSRWLFPSAHQGKGHRSDLHYYWARFRRAFGLPGFPIHSLRRSAATFMSRAGVKVENAQLLLWHTNIKTTVGYFRLEDSVLHGEAEKMTRAMLGQTRV